jgi:hypothetical protein
MLQKLIGKSNRPTTPGMVFSLGAETAFHFIVLVLSLLVLIASALLKHDGHGLQLFGIEWPLGCTLYQVTGVKCAFCGLTRSFCSMVRGELAAAMHYHWLGPVVFIFVCLQIPYRIYALGSDLTGLATLKRVGAYSAWGLGAALLINWFIYLGGLFL